MNFFSFAFMEVRPLNKDMCPINDFVYNILIKDIVYVIKSVPNTSKVIFRDGKIDWIGNDDIREIISFIS